MWTNILKINFKNRSNEESLRKQINEIHIKELHRIGFFGYEQYEVISWLSYIFQSLDKKVLIVDYSESHEMKNFIMLPNDLIVRDTVFEYRNIFYIDAKNHTKGFLKDIIEMEDYDILMVNFGTNFNLCSLFSYVESLLYVTDMSINHIDIVKQAKDKGICKKENLLLKRYYPQKISLKSITEDISISEEQVFVREYDLQEEMQIIYGQHLNDFKMTEISITSKQFLLEYLIEILGVERRSAEKALNKLVKGRE